jgi:hypothetical protein
MQALLDECARSYDLVIVDTPPLRPVTDAAVVAAGADGVVVVFWNGHTKRGLLRNSLNSLEAVNARVLGCVLNMVSLSRAERRRYTVYAPTVPARGRAATDRAATDTPATEDETVPDDNEAADEASANDTAGDDAGASVEAVAASPGAPGSADGDTGVRRPADTQRPRRTNNGRRSVKRR